jgi:hypothetical protein
MRFGFPESGLGGDDDDAEDADAEDMVVDVV